MADKGSVTLILKDGRKISTTIDQATGGVVLGNKCVDFRHIDYWNDMGYPASVYGSAIDEVIFH